jgi:RHS repeat-associated protein
VPLTPCDADSRTPSVTDPLFHTTSFTYDGNGTLLTKTDGLGNATTYGYEADDRLIGKQLDSNGDGTYDSTQRFVWSGDNIALAFDGSSNLTDRILPLPLGEGRGEGSTSADENSSNVVSWLLPDHEGTIRDVAQYNSGTNTTIVVDHLKYDSFGNITAQSNSAYQPLFGYTGQMWDANVGLYYYRARWYDPHTGRFISQDPLSFAAGDVNLYRYVTNSPTNFTDPTGLIGYGANTPGSRPPPPPLNDGAVAQGGGSNPLNWPGMAVYPIAKSFFDFVYGNLSAEMKIRGEQAELDVKLQAYNNEPRYASLKESYRDYNQHPLGESYKDLMELAIEAVLIAEMSAADFAEMPAVGATIPETMALEGAEMSAARAAAVRGEAAAMPRIQSEVAKRAANSANQGWRQQLQQQQKMSHTPNRGHRPEHKNQAAKLKDARRRAKLKADKEAARAAMQAKWDALTDEQRWLLRNVKGVNPDL